MKTTIALSLLMLLSPRLDAQIFGKPLTLTFDRSSSDNLENPKGVYFTYRATFDAVTGNCNQYSKIGGSGNTTNFIDTQMVPGIMYCYKEAFYNGTQSPMSDFPVIIGQ